MIYRSDETSLIANRTLFKRCQCDEPASTASINTYCLYSAYFSYANFWELQVITEDCRHTLSVRRVIEFRKIGEIHDVYTSEFENKTFL